MSKFSLKPKSTDKIHSEIDWDVVHRQIAEANQKLAASEEMDTAALEEAWAKRSVQMAQRLQDEQQGEMLKAAIVSLDNEFYGLDVRYIFDIKDLEWVTFVPRVPAWVLGVVNWRGRILSVVDFRRFLGLPTNGAEIKGKAQRLIVVQAGDMEVGLRVDEIYLIETIPQNKIRKEEGDVRGFKPELVDGVFMRSGHEKMENEEGIVVLLNLPALLSEPRLIIRDEIL